MVEGASFHNRQLCIASKIRSLLTSLTEDPSENEKITMKIEYWIEYVLCEQFATVDELAEGVSTVVWDMSDPYARSVVRFLKEFHDAPNRSGRARSFVDKLCERILRWFAMASVENLGANNYPGLVASCGGYGFIRAASFVGYLIEGGLLGPELVKRHLVKPLTAHHYTNQDNGPKFVRATAIYQLFIAAGNTLLCGLLKHEDVQACFETLNTSNILGIDAGKLKVRCAAHLDASSGSDLFGQEFREIHTAWLEREKEKVQETCAVENEEHEEEGVESVVVAEVPAEVETPLAFVPRDLPIDAIDIGIPSSILHDMERSSETSVNTPAIALSSPTFSISTVSDLTPTELGDESKYGEGQIATRHDTFYFEDGNVEIVCGDTVFRVHSTVVSFSSPKLRDMLSPMALHNAPMPKGCPRVVFKDSAEDFAALLKIIYTPGCVTSPQLGFDELTG